MAWIKLDPITRRRFARFRKIRRGYYALLILLGAMALSVIAPYLAESRAVLVVHQGKVYFPTFFYINMATFNQAPPAGWQAIDLEADYFRLQREWRLQRTRYDQERTKPGTDAQALEAKYPNHGG